MYGKLILLLILLSSGLRSQDTNKIKIEIKPEKWYTLKYQKFDNVFIVCIFQQHRDFNNEFEQLINEDTMFLSKQSYLAESNLISGIVLNYDKFQLSFGTRSQPPKEREGKGFTKAFNIGFNFGDNRWVSENY